MSEQPGPQKTPFECWPEEIRYLQRRRELRRRGVRFVIDDLDAGELYPTITGAEMYASPVDKLREKD